MLVVALYALFLSFILYFERIRGKLINVFYTYVYKALEDKLNS